MKEDDAFWKKVESLPLFLQLIICVLVGAGYLAVLYILWISFMAPHAAMK